MHVLCKCLKILYICPPAEIIFYFFLMPPGVKRKGDSCLPPWCDLMECHAPQRLGLISKAFTLEQVL